MNGIFGEPGVVDELRATNHGVEEEEEGGPAIDPHLLTTTDSDNGDNEEEEVEDDAVEVTDSDLPDEHQVGALEGCVLLVDDQPAVTVPQTVANVVEDDAIMESLKVETLAAMNLMRSPQLCDHKVDLVVGSIVDDEVSCVCNKQAEEAALNEDDGNGTAEGLEGLCAYNDHSDRYLKQLKSIAVGQPSKGDVFLVSLSEDATNALQMSEERQARTKKSSETMDSWNKRQLTAGDSTTPTGAQTIKDKIKLAFRSDDNSMITAEQELNKQDSCQPDAPDDKLLQEDKSEVSRGKLDQKDQCAVVSDKESTDCTHMPGKSDQELGHVEVHDTSMDLPATANQEVRSKNDDKAENCKDQSLKSDGMTIAAADYIPPAEGQEGNNSQLPEGNLELNSSPVVRDEEDHFVDLSVSQEEPMKSEKTALAEISQEKKGLHTAGELINEQSSDEVLNMSDHPAARRSSKRTKKLIYPNLFKKQKKETGPIESSKGCGEKELDGMTLEEAEPNAGQTAMKTGQSNSVYPTYDWKTILECKPSMDANLNNKLLFTDAKKKPLTRTALKLMEIDRKLAGDNGLIEPDPCPGCGDVFLLPTTFFQHLYRKSVQITYDCQLCSRLLEFTNKCLFRVHLRAHLEAENPPVKPLRSDHLKVTSLKHIDLGMDGEKLMCETRRLSANLSKNVPDLKQCMECLAALPKNEFDNHLAVNCDQYKPENKCDICERMLPSACSRSAHQRIHSKRPPYVCPECGEEFLTWTIFKVHLSRNCFHDSKKCLYTCDLCDKNGTVYSDIESMLSHIVDNHCKIFFKCKKCPRAFRASKAFRKHSCSAKKEGSTTFKKIYKSPMTRCDLFFTSLESLRDHVKKQYKFKLTQAFSCNNCDENFRGKKEFSEHTKECQHDFLKDNMFKEHPIEDKFVEIKDDLRRISDESICKGCLKQCRNFDNHISKHHKSKVDLPSLPNNLKNNMAQVNSLQSVCESKSRSKLKADPMMESPPDLKVKIKLNLGKDSIGKASHSNLIPDGIPLVKSEPSLEKLSKQGNSILDHTSQPPAPLVEFLGINFKRESQMRSKSRNPYAHGLTISSDKKKIKKNSLTCRICKEQFESRTECNKHILEHYSPPNVDLNGKKDGDLADIHQCKECGACFLSEPSWKRHRLLSHGIRNPIPRKKTLHITNGNCASENLKQKQELAKNSSSRAKGKTKCEPQNGEHSNQAPVKDQLLMDLEKKMEVVMGMDETEDPLPKKSDPAERESPEGDQKMCNNGELSDTESERLIIDTGGEDSSQDHK